MRFDLMEKVQEMSLQNPYLCMQCGTCSSSCTAAGVMEMMPRQVMRYIQLNNCKVLETSSVWVCTSCHTCTARCPRGIDIARVMEALRAINLRKGYDILKPENISPEFLTEIPQMALTSGFRKLSA